MAVTFERETRGNKNARSARPPSSGSTGSRLTSSSAAFAAASIRCFAATATAAPARLAAGPPAPRPLPVAAKGRNRRTPPRRQRASINASQRATACARPPPRGLPRAAAAPAGRKAARRFFQTSAPLPPSPAAQNASAAARQTAAPAQSLQVRFRIHRPAFARISNVSARETQSTWPASTQSPSRTDAAIKLPYTVSIPLSWRRRTV